MIEFIPQKQAPQRETLTADLGEGIECIVKPWEDPGASRRWHANITLGKIGFQTLLIQGFGRTPMEAVQGAIKSERTFHQAALERIAKLQQRLAADFDAPKTACTHNWLGGYCDLCGTVKEGGGS